MPTPDVWHARALEILDREQNRGGAVDCTEESVDAPTSRNARFDSPPPPSIHAFGSGEDYEGRHIHTVECYDC